jgi:hypothetical protein
MDEITALGLGYNLMERRRVSGKTTTLHRFLCYSVDSTDKAAIEANGSLRLHERDHTTCGCTIEPVQTRMPAAVYRRLPRESGDRPVRLMPLPDAHLIPWKFCCSLIASTPNDYAYVMKGAADTRPMRPFEDGNVQLLCEVLDSWCGVRDVVSAVGNVTLQQVLQDKGPDYGFASLRMVLFENPVLLEYVRAVLGELLEDGVKAPWDSEDPEFNKARLLALLELIVAVSN